VNSPLIQIENEILGSLLESVSYMMCILHAWNDANRYEIVGVVAHLTE